MFTRLRLSLILLAALALAPAIPARSAGIYKLAYWREVGTNENAGNHSIFVWVWDETGTPKQGVKLYTTWDVLLATTDADGRAEIPIDVSNDHYDIKCVDTAGSQSEVAFDMTSRRWPSWGHYSYELGFMFKADQASQGTFDTSLSGTINTSTVYDNDAPATKSLCYYSTNTASASSDSYSLGSWSDSHGQTFVATGDRIAAVQFHGAIGGNYNLNWTAEILQGGPNGARVAGPKSIPNRQPILWVLPFGVNEAQVTPGQTYYLKITRSGGLNTYRTGNNYPNGNYHLNGVSQPAEDLQGFVCCMTVGAPPGTIRGVVRSGGTELPGALLTVNPGGFQQTSQPDGSYAFTGMQQGSYTVTAWKPGYSTSTSASYSVSQGNTTVVDFELASLTNLVSNSGFESGALTPWVTYGGGLTVYSSLNWAIPSHTGQRYAGAISSWGTLAGGAYCTLPATAGQSYAASSYIYNDSWQDGDRANEFPGNCRGRIGIDPAGGTNPTSGSIVWSAWNTSFNNYGLSKVTAPATAPQITVFLQYAQNDSHEWNKNAFDDVFVTANVDNPDLQIVAGPQAAPSTTSALVTWSTNVASDARIYYGTTSAYGQTNYISTPATGHSFNLAALQPNTTYHYKVTSAATGYDLAQSSDLTFTTSSAPVVHITSGPTVSGITQTSATITWATDIDSTSEVAYGTTAAYGQSAAGTSGTTSHSVTLNGLSPSQTYHYQVTSAAAGYGAGISADATFQTAVPPGTLLNPGFEQQDAYWTRYGTFEDGGDNGIQGTGWYFDFNPHGGVNFAGSASSYSIKNGGFYQRVPAVSGRGYKFSAFAKTKNVGSSASDTNNRVGIDPTGGTDPAAATVIWSARNSPAVWTGISAVAVARSSYITVFLDAQQLLGVEWNINAFDDCSLTTLPQMSIGQAKMLADGSDVALNAKIVNGRFSGIIYVQEQDWSSGIRVIGGTQAVGAIVDVTGTLGSLNGERYVLPGSIVQTSGKTLKAGPGMNNLLLGGGNWNYNSGTGAGQRGTDQAIGLNNVGLLVRSWGGYSYVNSTTFNITDGSGVSVKCIVPATVTLSPSWTFAEVGGVIATELVGGSLQRVIRVRNQADVKAF